MSSLPDCIDLRIADTLTLDVEQGLYDGCGPIRDFPEYDFEGSPNVFYWRLVVNTERGYINVADTTVVPTTGYWNLKALESPSNVRVEAEPSESSCNYRETEVGGYGGWSLVNSNLFEKYYIEMAVGRLFVVGIPDFFHDDTYHCGPELDIYTCGREGSENYLCSEKNFEMPKSIPYADKDVEFEKLYFPIRFAGHCENDGILTPLWLNHRPELSGQPEHHFHGVTKDGWVIPLQENVQDNMYMYTDEIYINASNGDLRPVGFTLNAWQNPSYGENGHGTCDNIVQEGEIKYLYDPVRERVMYECGPARKTETENLYIFEDCTISFTASPGYAPNKDVDM